MKKQAHFIEKWGPLFLSEYPLFQISPKFRDPDIKLGCVVRMVVDSTLPHAKIGPNDHRKDAPQFRLISDCEFYQLHQKKNEDFEIESEIGHLGNQCFSEELISFKISVKSVPGWMMFSLEDVPFF